MNFLVFPHLGLGDQFVMNGFIHYLYSLTSIEEICIIAKAYQKDTLVHLYSDFPKITFYWISETSETSGSSWEEKDLFLKSINHMPFGLEVMYKGKKFILTNFGSHSLAPFRYEITNWADAFYRQANLPITFRRNFMFPSNMQHSKELYNRVINQIKTSDYIIIHDDPTRERFIDNKLLYTILLNNGTDKLPILYLGRNRYDYKLQENLENKGSNELLQVSSLLDYYDLLKNAKECHVMDSSIGILLDYIQDSASKLYKHQYITSSGPGTSSHQETHILRKWTVLFQND